MTALREIDREAARVLPRLSTQGAFAKPIKNRRFGIFGSKSNLRHPQLICSGAIMTALLHRELVREAGSTDCPKLDAIEDVYVLSEIGRQFVRRLSAADMPHRSQHGIQGSRYIRSHDKAKRFHVVNLAETPLGWLRKRKGADGRALISETEFAAGEKLREDFTKAQMTPRVTSDWSAGPSTGGRKKGPSDQLCVQEAALAAKQRLFIALEKAGPGLSDILLQTCCYLNGLEQAERELGWPQRSGKVVLQIGLARLVEHYGLNGTRKLSR